MPDSTSSAVTSCQSTSTPARSPPSPRIPAATGARSSDAGGDPGTVSHETILVAPRDFANRPVATSLDVRKQLSVLDRQLSRMARVQDLLDGYPAALTFDLDVDPDKPDRPRCPAAELAAAIGTVHASYGPEMPGHL